MKKSKVTTFINRLQEPRFRALVIISAFAVVGAVILIATKAAVPISSFEAENGTLAGAKRQADSNASGGSAVRFGPSGTSTGDVRRFFADDASWNRPVSDYGESLAFAGYADRFWNYAGLPAAPGATNVDFKDYSVPIYNINEANDSVQLFQATWVQSQQAFTTAPGAGIGMTVPWNFNWKPGTGNDRIMHVANYDTGYQYGMWIVGEQPISCVDRNIFGITAFDGPNAKAGFNENNPKHLCIGAFDSYDGLYSIKDGTTHNNRGMGIDKLALVTRADEVKSGTIRHALEFTITSTMFGAPECSPNKGSSAPGAGTSCGFYVAPATRVEFASNENNRIGNRCTGNPINVDNDARSKTVPEGMRFAIKITDGEIEAWLNSRGYTGAKRNTAKIFAVALRDYGGVVGETGCYGIGIETDGVINPTSANTWSQLGITDIANNDNPHGDLIQGLLTRERLYVVNPPN